MLLTAFQTVVKHFMLPLLSKMRLYFYIYSENEGNPLVAGFQDDVDLDEEPTAKQKSVNVRHLSADVELSSDGEGDGDDVEQEKHPVTSEVKRSTSEKHLSSDIRTSPPHSANNSTDLNNPEVHPRSNNHLNTAVNHCTQERTQHELNPTSDLKPEVFQNGRIEDADESRNQESILEDTEDISDEEVTTSSKPVDSGLATDTTVVSKYCD